MNTDFEVALARHDAPAQARKPHAKPVPQTVALSTGVTLPFVEQGHAAGVPVVLLHGLTDSWHSFERVLPHLPESIHALVPTQRGHGDATRPATGYRTRDFAADAEAFLDALGVESAVIVGHSLGSTNALRFAIDRPHRVRGLILVGAFAGYRGNPVISEFWDAAVSTLTDPVDAAFAREFQESTLAQPVPHEFIDLAVRESLKVPARVWRDALAGCLEDDFAAEIMAIKAPTLAVWGSRDALVPRADQDRLLARIAGSRLVVYQDAGHAPHWEEPECFATDVSAFVATLQR